MILRAPIQKASSRYVAPRKSTSAPRHEPAADARPEPATETADAAALDRA